MKKLFLSVVIFLPLFTSIYLRADANFDLMDSATQGDLEGVKEALKGANIHAQDNSVGWEALARAAGGGHLSIIKYLLENAKIDTNAKGPDGMTALMVAARANQLPVVQYFVETTKSDVNEKDNNGKTALMWATQTATTTNRLPLVQYLVESAKADINTRDSTGKTMLDDTNIAPDIRSYLRSKGARYGKELPPVKI